MRIMVLFDLPVETPLQRHNYGKFRRYLIKNGFMMMQESVYVKLALNQNTAAAIIDGGHVRVGFEDNVFISKGVVAKSNGELVAKVVRMAKEFGREIATPAEARQILGLKPKA